MAICPTQCNGGYGSAGILGDARRASEPRLEPSPMEPAARPGWSRARPGGLESFAGRSRGLPGRLEGFPVSRQGQRTGSLGHGAVATGDRSWHEASRRTGMRLFVVREPLSCRGRARRAMKRRWQRATARRVSRCSLDSDDWMASWSACSSPVDHRRAEARLLSRRRAPWPPMPNDPLSARRRGRPGSRHASRRHSRCGP